MKKSILSNYSRREALQTISTGFGYLAFSGIAAKQALAGMQAGQLLEVIATDAGSWRDFESFVEHSRHTLVEREQADGIYRYWLRKADGDAPA